MRAVCKYLHGLFDNPQLIVPIQEFWGNTIVAIYNSVLKDSGQSMIDLVTLRNLPCGLFLTKFHKSSIEELLSLALKLPKDLKIEAIIFDGLKSDTFISLSDFPNLLYIQVGGVKSPIPQTVSGTLSSIPVMTNGNFKVRVFESVDLYSR